MREKTEGRGRRNDSDTSSNRDTRSVSLNLSPRIWDCMVSMRERGVVDPIFISGERVGAFTMVCGDTDEAARVASQIKILVSY